MYQNSLGFPKEGNLTRTMYRPKTDWQSPYLCSEFVAMKIWRVQVQLYWVCLVVELHLLHHLIIDEPADAVHEVLGSIHWGKLAHKSSVLSLRSYHNLGVSLQNGIVVACMEKLVDIKSKLKMIKLVLLNSFIHSSSTVLTCISKANKCGDSIFIFEGKKKIPTP